MFISQDVLANRQKGCFVGLVVGDAMGAPVEFRKRGTFRAITKYTSGGKFNLQAGEWTDDTAMALCLAHSLIECNGFDAIDQLNKYLAWWHFGYMSCNGKSVGIGKTIMRSLLRYSRTKEPYSSLTNEKFSGNGSIMRLAPVCIYYANDLNKAVYFAKLSSKTTHGSTIAIDSCRYLAFVILYLFQSSNKEAIFTSEFSKTVYLYFKNNPLHSALKPIIELDFLTKNQDEIKSSGYAIDSLEAALWCFYNTNNFKDAVLKAVNLGGDADTIAAITGQIAGAFYGIENISKELINNLCKSNLIILTAEKLIRNKGK